jgi:glycerate-2-kinase
MTPRRRRDSAGDTNPVSRRGRRIMNPGRAPPLLRRAASWSWVAGESAAAGAGEARGGECEDAALSRSLRMDGREGRVVNRLIMGGRSGRTGCANRAGGRMCPYPPVPDKM